MEIKSNSPKETQKIAQKFAKEILPGDIIALYGDLGSGKTIFAQGLAKGLKIKRKITSPTFVFMRSYPFKFKKQDLTFYHLDLYRGEQEKDFARLGLEEVFQEDSVTILEWAQNIKNSLPKKRIDVIIEKIDDTKRRIKIKRNK